MIGGSYFISDNDTLAEVILWWEGISTHKTHLHVLQNLHIDTFIVVMDSRTLFSQISPDSYLVKMERVVLKSNFSIYKAFVPVSWLRWYGLYLTYNYVYTIAYI